MHPGPQADPHGSLKPPAGRVAPKRSARHQRDFGNCISARLSISLKPWKAVLCH